MKDILLTAPENELDKAARDMITKWSLEPTPLEVLETLDACIYRALASDFVVSVLQIYYTLVCDKHKTTHDEVVKNATWRKNT